MQLLRSHQSFHNLKRIKRKNRDKQNNKFYQLKDNRTTSMFPCKLTYKSKEIPKSCAETFGRQIAVYSGWSPKEMPDYCGNSIPLNVVNLKKNKAIDSFAPLYDCAFEIAIGKFVKNDSEWMVNVWWSAHHQDLINFGNVVHSRELWPRPIFNGFFPLQFHRHSLAVYFCFAFIQTNIDWNRNRTFINCANIVLII